METVGSLVDKISIAKIRQSKAAEAGNRDIEIKAMAQVNDLELELDELIDKIAAGSVTRIREDKNKIYHGEKTTNIQIAESIGKNIELLFVANLTLWNLEDLRRDKTLSDADRLLAADNVSVYNKIRNEKMDKINELIEQKFKKG